MAPSTRRRLLLLLGITVTAAVVVVGLTRYLIDEPYQERLIVDQLEERLGRDVSVSSTELVVWPRPGLRLRDLEIATDPPVAGSPFVAARGLLVTLRLLPLLRGHVVLGRVTIDQPAIVVTRDAAGVLSIADLLGHGESRKREQRPRAAASSQRESDLFGAHVTVTGGALTFVDEAAPGGTLAVKVRNLAVDLRPRPRLGPRFTLQAAAGPEEAGGSVAMEGSIGRLPRPWDAARLPFEVRLRLQETDLRRLTAYLPPRWQTRVPETVLTTDLAISRTADDDVAVSGRLRLEKTHLRHAISLAGTIDADVDGTFERGVIAAKTKLRLAPGTFSKEDDIVIDGHTDIDAAIRAGGGPFEIQARVDATRAIFRMKNVFEKPVGTPLVLGAHVVPTASGIAVRDAEGHLGAMAITGHADIGHAPGRGRSTPFGLYFGALDMDLSAAAAYVAATEPFAIAGRAQVHRLDILRRPEERRQWQVMIDAEVTDAQARLPMADGRAHVVDGLSTALEIKPGLLRATGARTRINGVPLSFDGTASEFMSLISDDPDRPRAALEVAVKADGIDLDELLRPAGKAAGDVDTGSGKAAEPTEQAGPGAGSLPFAERLTLERATLEAPAATYLGQPLTDLHVAIGYVPTTLRIEDARFGLHGGRGNVSGSIVFDGGPSFALDVGARDVQLRECLAAFSRSSPPRGRGLVDGAVHVEARGASLAAWRPTLAGSGSVTVRDGVLPGFNLIEVLADAMLRFFPGKHSVSLAGTNPFSLLEQHFELSSKGLVANAATLVTDDYHLSGKGQISFAGDLDYDTRVALTAKGTQKILTVVVLPIPGTARVTLPAIPVRVTGDVTDPRITPDVSALPMAPLRAIGGAGRRGVRAVGRGIKRMLGQRGEEDRDEGAETTDASPGSGATDVPPPSPAP